MEKPSEQREIRKEQAPRQVVVMNKQEGELKNHDPSFSWEYTLPFEVQEMVSYFQTLIAP